MDSIDSSQTSERLRKAENLADESLMFAYAKGDAEAFEVLYRRHKDPLYRYFVRQLNGSGNKSREQAIAEELFQEVWIKLIKSAENYKASAKFTTYLYHLAHNILIDFYRSKDHKLASQYEKKIASGSLYSETGGSVAGIDEVIADTSPAAEDQLAIQQQFAFLIELLAILSAPQREVFLLKETSGLSIKAIAEILEESAEAVKSRYRYAIKNLRKGLIEKNRSGADLPGFSSSGFSSSGKDPNDTS